MRVLVTAKQVPQVESFALDDSGRLNREGVPVEMNAYCRRAVAQGVKLARQTGGHCTVVSLGPPRAEEVLREALAWGADDVVLLSDPAFAGSDTLATARALAALVAREGPFELVLVGRSSLDAETGQVGPELAELLDFAFAAAVRELELDEHNGAVRVHCEQDDGRRVSVVELPAVLAVAERLCAPAKVPREVWSAIAPSRVRTLGAWDLAGAGPWGAAGSPTRVGALRTLGFHRDSIRCTGPVAEQVDMALEVLLARGALEAATSAPTGPVPAIGYQHMDGQLISVLVEPDRPQLARELLGCAASLAAVLGGRVAAIAMEMHDLGEVWSWGADELVCLSGTALEEDVSAAVSGWALEREPTVMLAPASYWGREVASRIAARLGAGLTGDALDLEMDVGRLVAWKSACGGSRLAAITATSPLQMATVRPGVFDLLPPRGGGGVATASVVAAQTRGRVRVEATWRDDEVELLARARVVVGVGACVPPQEYSQVHKLAGLLGAELAGTRKVTDKGWLPRSRQVGVTGRSISPRLYVAVGISGKLNHLVGVRGAGTILALNSDADAPIFSNCDVGIVGDWREVVALLGERLGGRVLGAGAHPVAVGTLGGGSDA